MACVGSVEELKNYTGVELDDLHREHVDPLEFSVEGEKGKYKRITEVLDCWFESGSMPYAQLHYPFENKEMFEKYVMEDQRKIHFDINESSPEKKNEFEEAREPKIELF